MRSPTRPMVLLTAATISAVTVAIGVPQPAEAAIIQYNSRATFDALGPYVTVDWGLFGPTGTTIDTPDSRTVGGINVGINSSQGSLMRLDEGSGFTGTFAVGDHLLADGGSLSDSFLVRFSSSPVFGFGTQIDAHYITGAFTGGVDVYGLGNVLLYTANFAGNNTLAQDNSAPFVGIMSDQEISRAQFWIDQSGDFPQKSGPLAINRLDVIADPVLPVPEPSTLALMVSAILGFIGFGFWRRKSA